MDMFVWRLLLLALTLGTACGKSALLGGPCSGTCPPDGGSGGDGGKGSDGGIVDLGPACMRSCSTGMSSVSLQCTSAGANAYDRACPAYSMCMDGYCRPPQPQPDTSIGKPCMSDNDCPSSGGAVTCEPFVDPATKKISWICGIFVGNNGAGDPCTKGSQCGTGFCGNNGTCLQPCATNLDCPQQSGTTCQETGFTVEGVAGTVGSCR
jgi:hypothetical protein